MLPNLALEQFVGALCHAAINAPEGVASAIVLDNRNEDGVLVLGMENAEQDQEDVWYMLNATDHTPLRFAGLATRVAWAPDDFTEATASWAITAVGRDEAAWFAVKRDIEQRWHRIDPTDAPWFMLSTASALREYLKSGYMTPMRNAKDDRLLQKPRDGVIPPTHPDGLI